MDKTILFYPSGHGFGHAVRQIEIIKEIFKYNIQNGCGHRVIVRTLAPEWVFQKSLFLYFERLYPRDLEKISEWFSYHRVQNDVGTAQKDSLNMDIAATYEAAREFYSDFSGRVAREAEFIVSARVDTVVGDIPPLAFAAASAAGVRSVGVTNFSWDFIYEEFLPDNPGFSRIIDTIRGAYAKCGKLLRLPFACPLPAFGNIADAGLIARKPYIGRTEVMGLLGFGPDEFDGRASVMISFGGFDTLGIKHENLARCGEKFIFLTTVPPAAGERYPANVKYIDTAAAGISFENLFTVFDVIVTKPGYGVVGDIIGAGAMCLYTDRGRFREYEYLVKFLEKHCVSSDYISRDEMLNCDLEKKIAGLSARRKTPPPICLDGARQCAMAIIE